MQLRTDQKANQLQAIPYLLQTNLDGLKQGYDFNHDLANMASASKLGKPLGLDSNHPTSMIFGISAIIETEVSSIVDRLVKSFLKGNQSLIVGALRTDTGSPNDLHYCIALKKDNMRNRKRIFGFLDQYDLLDISARFPVIFQFVPFEMLDELRRSEVICLIEETSNSQSITPQSSPSRAC